MKKMILFIVLMLCVVSVSIPAWSTDRTGSGDVIYEDPSPPKK